MKIWMHILAGLVGFVAAGLIVFLVFGNASRDGATQDGSAPASLEASDGSLCGTLTPAQAAQPAALEQAAKNLPTIIGESGRPIAISPDKPAQGAWVNRIVAAGGLCLDELEIPPVGPDSIVRVSLSTVDGMSQADAGAFTGGALLAAFAEPLNRPFVLVTTFVGGKARTIYMSQRAAANFFAWRRANGAGTGVADLIRFSRAVKLGPKNLRILGWG